MKLITKILAITSLSVSISANALTRSQHDTAVGAVIGGVAGAVMGNDIPSTVAGVALGGVVGSQWNAGKLENDNRHHKYRKIHRDDRRKYHKKVRHSHRYYDNGWHKGRYKHRD